MELNLWKPADTKPEFGRDILLKLKSTNDEVYYIVSDRGNYAGFRCIEWCYVSDLLWACRALKMALQSIADGIVSIFNNPEFALRVLDGIAREPGKLYYAQEFFDPKDKRLNNLWNKPTQTPPFNRQILVKVRGSICLEIWKIDCQGHWDLDQDRCVEWIDLSVYVQSYAVLHEEKNIYKQIVQEISDYVFGGGLAVMSASKIRESFERNGVAVKCVETLKTKISISKEECDDK